MSRKAAAEIGGMDRQTLRDWAHRFNAKGPRGLINGRAPGPVPKLSSEQKQELGRIVETGSDPARMVFHAVKQWLALIPPFKSRIVRQKLFSRLSHPARRRTTSAQIPKPKGKGLRSWLILMTP
jgi:hypothetical protein